MLNDAKRVPIESRAGWRSWLSDNHRSPDGVWVVRFKVHVEDRHVSYNAVVEEALCFGWIDSRPRKLDDDRTMLYVSPRKPGSPWSRLNKERIERLTADGRMTPAGQAKIDAAKADGSWTIYDDIEDLVIPDDLAAALAADPVAQRYFEVFSDSSKKGILWWIKTAKRETTRAKRIAETVRKATKNVKARG